MTPASSWLKTTEVTFFLMLPGHRKPAGPRFHAVPAPGPSPGRRPLGSERGWRCTGTEGRKNRAVSRKGPRAGRRASPLWQLPERREAGRDAFPRSVSVLSPRVLLRKAGRA